MDDTDPSLAQLEHSAPIPIDLLHYPAIITYINYIHY